MGITIGPVDWWVATPDGIDSMAISCPLGTILPDKSAVICRAGGVAWIVAPATTQVIESWAGGQYNTTLVGDKCCVSEWSSLCSALVSAGFNPGDWFVPCYQLLQNPGYVCRTNWDSFSVTCYWSSTEFSATNAYGLSYFSGGGACSNLTKASTRCVRAFRCVTY